MYSVNVCCFLLLIQEQHEVSRSPSRVYVNSWDTWGEQLKYDSDSYSTFVRAKVSPHILWFVTGICVFCLQHSRCEFLSRSLEMSTCVSQKLCIKSKLTEHAGPKWPLAGWAECISEVSISVLTQPMYRNIYASSEDRHEAVAEVEVTLAHWWIPGRCPFVLYAIHWRGAP